MKDAPTPVDYLVDHLFNGTMMEPKLGVDLVPIERFHNPVDIAIRQGKHPPDDDLADMLESEMELSPEAKRHVARLLRGELKRGRGRPPRSSREKRSAHDKRMRQLWASAFVGEILLLKDDDTLLEEIAAKHHQDPVALRAELPRLTQDDLIERSAKKYGVDPRDVRNEIRVYSSESRRRARVQF